jgi:hypothetical protein
MTCIYRVTLRHPDGNAMFVGAVDTEEIIEIPKCDKPAMHGGPPSSSPNGDPMTDPQRRYLFRLLAEQNVERKAEAQKEANDAQGMR